MNTSLCDIFLDLKGFGVVKRLCGMMLFKKQQRSRMEERDWVGSIRIKLGIFKGFQYYRMDEIGGERIGIRR